MRTVRETGLGLPADPAPHLAPAELRARAAPHPEPALAVLGREEGRGVTTEEVSFRTDVLDGAEIRMHGFLARPSRAADGLAPLLLVPGGRATLPAETVSWFARETGALVLGVDWIGAGGSSRLPGIDPWGNAFRYEGDDVSASFQMHNLRGLLQATEVLLRRPGADGDRLLAVGSSWGAFYSLLLAGIDRRFRAAHLNYGCGFLDLGCRQIWQAQLATMPEWKGEAWFEAFDPGRRAHLVEADVFLAQATNDRYFSLPATMRTYHALAGEKRLLLVRNQDHSLHPYEQLTLRSARASVAGTFPSLLPSVECSWVPGAARVEVGIEPPAAGAVEVVYSAGTYGPWAARRWRSVPARDAGGRFVAELPIVDPRRELWVYAHLDTGTGLAASSPVLRVTPADEGVVAGTARPVAGFDFASEPFWSLPVGDRGNPTLELAEDGPATGLTVRFENDDELRALCYCLEGDLVEAEGYDTVELLVRASTSTDVGRFQLIVATDYATFAEQDYGLPLAELGVAAGEWTRVGLRLDDLRPLAHRVYHDHEPVFRPLERGRICGVGVRRSAPTDRGEVTIADVRLLHSEPKVAEAADAELRFETSLPPDELRARLAAWAPWRHQIHFSNGVTTAELEHGEMFVWRPLEKWAQVAPHLPLSELRGGRALDVGSNIGQYSLLLAQQLGMDVVGLESNRRNLEVARFLAELAGATSVRFVEGDAGTWRELEDVDLIVHFATLDHLRHPLLALENAAWMLRPGGTLALELQILDRPEDDLLCRYVGTSDTSTTCCWFIGRGALLRMLAEAGFEGVRVVHEWRRPEAIGADMARLTLVATRSGR